MDKKTYKSSRPKDARSKSQNPWGENTQKTTLLSKKQKNKKILLVEKRKKSKTRFKSYPFKKRPLNR